VALKNYYVYVLASISRILYVGVTNDLERRVAEHVEGLTRGFTARYHVKRLVYFETFGEIEAAIAREKQSSTMACPGPRALRLTAVAGGAVAGLLGRLSTRKLDTIGGRDLAVKRTSGPFVDVAAAIGDDWSIRHGGRRSTIHRRRSLSAR
jgi:predicted GIY-YIG superfamily endonuclease